MMMLNQNKQKMYYALQDKIVPIYETDEEGNIIYYEDAEGNKIPLETGDTKLSYGEPIEFYGNISMSGGEAETVEYGVNIGDYEAILTVDKGLLPLSEISLVWYENEPRMNEDGTVDEHSADYEVVKVSPSLNTYKYVLKKVVK